MIIKRFVCGFLAFLLFALTVPFSAFADDYSETYSLTYLRYVTYQWIDTDFASQWHGTTYLKKFPIRFTSNKFEFSLTNDIYSNSRFNSDFRNAIANINDDFILTIDFTFDHTNDYFKEIIPYYQVSDNLVPVILSVKQSGYTYTYKIKYPYAETIYNGQSYNAWADLLSFSIDDMPLPQVIGFNLESVDVTIDDNISRLNKIMTDLFGWLQRIINKIGEIPDKLSSEFSAIKNNLSNWFSDLSGNLKTWFDNLKTSISNFSSSVGGWFSDLGEKLRDWFKNVGDWFAALGDRIGDFFTNIWINISNSITDIRTSISDWWQSVVDWFHSLFTPEEGFFDNYKVKWDKWMSAHFGFLYQSIDLVNNIINIFSDFGSSDKCIITIPEIRLPFLNNPVILETTTFDLGGFVENSEMLSTCLEGMQVVLAFGVGYGLILLAKKTFEEILAEREL